MIIDDFALDSFIFKDPVQLFYSDGKQPLSREVTNMEEVTDLLDEIHDNGWPKGIGPYSIEFQLWFSLARRAKFFKQD